MGLLIRFGIFVLLSFGLIKTNNNFFLRNEYKIKSVEITGINEDISKDFFFFKDKFIGKSLSDIDLQEVESLIKKDIRIDEVNVNIVDFNKLNIDIKKRKPKYYLQYNNKIFLIDKNDVIYGEIGDEKISSLPFILVKNNFEISSLLGIIKNIEDILKGNISQIYKVDEHCVNVVLINGATLKTNNTVPLEKYRIGKNLCFGLSKEKKIDYIDLRFEDYIVKYLEDKNGKQYK
ncbi:cell division protein FtsQ/DivIB [Fusobacterium sp.]|uniref:cell division protein FtsQ/DivIB n=1 Tax=Fusobacterium sp. TaxID=68766 RepID=UPI00262B4EA4|nr:cell division protein FtsQ/DivIB [Fusobacterium sp.]